MERNIIDSLDQSMYGQPQVSFRPNDFDSVIWAHGYDIVIVYCYAKMISFTHSFTSLFASNTNSCPLSADLKQSSFHELAL